MSSVSAWSLRGLRCWDVDLQTFSPDFPVGPFAPRAPLAPCREGNVSPVYSRTEQPLERLLTGGNSVSREDKTGTHIGTPLATTSWLPHRTLGKNKTCRRMLLVGRISINQSIPLVPINGPTFFPFSPSEPTVPGNPSDPCRGGGNTQALRSTDVMFFMVVYCLLSSCHVYLGSLSPRITRQPGNSQFTLKRDGSKEAVKTKYQQNTEQTIA